MPIYEYRCMACRTKFEARRSFSQADDPFPCPECGSTETRRLISTFIAFSSGSDGATTAVAGSGGCAACASSSCATCGRN